MRANLPQREPDMLKYWESMGVYEKMLENAAGKPTFVLHDGPPFSNGHIHMGHALNKVLKDFINKSRTMMGYRVPYIPGWDNHGMPIESAIIKQNKLDRNKMSVPEFRDACQKFAQNFIDIQREEFKRLGITGDWDHPYKTMSPDFEAREVKVFGEMYRRGYIYKGMKPVYWCPKDETALAEAEIEYQTDKCVSIYVKFRVKDDKSKLTGIDLSHTYFLIWTTTTWTLPGNQLITLSPDDTYVVVSTENGENYIVAEALMDATMAAGGLSDYKVIRSFKGSDLEYMTAQHPFLDRESLIATADYVTMDSGTGCVHTAGGFGADDYATTRRYNIDVVVPVDDKGYQTADAGKFAGLFYAKSNDAILEDLKETGALFASREFDHEYPHCWRCKSPIIYRATPQWFCSVDAFKEEAVKACDKVRWIPEWGKERMVQMIRERADWCISRQRKWGLPIPVFYCEDCGEIICDEKTIDSISAWFAKEGSNSWFAREAAELLPAGYTCPKCKGHAFVKEQNTLDGWFDSGSTHFPVIDENEKIGGPADVYLEGADQYRGWFQSSLLTSVGSSGKAQAPFKTVITHGWTVDGEGRAMHKSLGNGVAPEEMISKYGADLVRLWVASSDYTVDVRVSDQILRQLSEAYRKIRNTARILLANLNDFNPDTDMVSVDRLEELDKWLLSGLEDLIRECRNAYDNYQFHLIYHAITNFCTVDLSKLYVDITKDRVYVEKKDSTTRRAAQTTMFLTLDAMTRLLAPMISFTAEEIWQIMPHRSTDNRESVFLNRLPDAEDALSFGDLREHWDTLFALRDNVMKALEQARADKKIGKSLDAKVVLYTKNPEEQKTLHDFEKELAPVFITSGVELSEEDAPADAFTEEGSDISVEVRAADGCRCDRCWGYSTKGEKDEEGGFICARCLKIIQG